MKPPYQWVVRTGHTEARVFASQMAVVEGRLVFSLAGLVIDTWAPGAWDRCMRFPVDMPDPDE